MRDYLVFWIGPDGGDRESCSVYYSKIVNESTKTKAIKVFIRDWEGISNLIDIDEYMEENELTLDYYGTLDCTELKIGM